VPVQPRTRFGPYEILSALGAGGMGEVYKARDTRLDRTVAIKILNDTLAADPQFRERFDREARAISQLDHPHICALYDVGDQDGAAFLVMQYLEGETLADRLTKGPLPIERALTTAIEIASALDKAHRAGIVHRDLKPGNIMLTKAGAKLLDFGLAKSGSPVVAGAAFSMLPTTPPNLTAPGAILGTFQYMSPEQIEGQDTDARSDIFAFGVVLYEMVTGQKAFTGKTHASLISSILRDQPRPLAELQPLTPPLLDHVVGRCLAKDPDERWQGAGDLARELRWVAETGAAARAALPVAGHAGRGRLALGSAAVFAGLLAGIAATMLVARLGNRRPVERPREVTRAFVSIVPAEHLQARSTDRTTTEGRPSRTAMVWSPDGRTIMFTAVQGDRQQLYRRGLDQLAATPIPDTEGASGPFFSPDGRWVGFWSAGALKKTSVDGSGPATTICSTPMVFGASWGADDTIIFSRATEGLWRVSAAGGTAQVLFRPDANKGELKYFLPQILPGGRAVLFTVTHTPLPTWDDTEVVAQSIGKGERTVLVRGGADGRYVSSGHLLYVRRGTLMAVPFDLQRLEVAGGAVALISDVMQAGNTPNEASDSGAGQFSVSESGALLYVPGGLFPDPERSLVWVDRSGAGQPLALPTRAYLSPRLSPDGRRVVLWTQGDRNVWVHDLARGTLTRLTSEARNARPVWTPDGARVAFGSAAGGNENIFWRPADGSAPAERLTTSDDQDAAASWSPDGQTMAFVRNGAETQHDIWVLPLTGDRRPRAIVQTRFDEGYPEFSPDGHWLAYASDESGRSEVYVRPYPGPGPRQQASTDGGTAPAWSRDGRELFYTTTQSVGGQATLTRMMAIPLTWRPTLSTGAPHMLFQGRYGASAVIRGYDVTSDGQRFLMIQQKERPPLSGTDMVLVQNWVDELNARVPTK
jgi:eukaryotic-like serine/threonine-protein kinase